MILPLRQEVLEFFEVAANVGILQYFTIVGQTLGLAANTMLLLRYQKV